MHVSTDVKRIFDFKYWKRGVGNKCLLCDSIITMLYIVIRTVILVTLLLLGDVLIVQICIVPSVL